MKEKSDAEKLVEAITTPEPKVKPVTFPTGLTLLDSMVGGGLYGAHLAGDIIRVVGDTASGKTYLLMEHIAAAYHKFGDKFKWLYDNAEGGFSFWNAADLWNLPVDAEHIVKSDTVQESYFRAVKFYEDLADDEFGIFCLDSLDGLIGENTQKKVEIDKKIYLGEADKKAAKGMQRAEVQAYLSQTYFKGIVPYLNSSSPNRKNALFMFVSQLRAKNMTGIGSTKPKPSGGNAARFYPDTRIDLEMVTPITAKDDVFKQDRMVGAVTLCTLKKTRTPRPEREFFFSYFFNTGLSEIDTCLDYVYDLRKKTKDSKNGKVTGGEQLAKVLWDKKEMTRAALIKLAIKDPLVLKQLKEMAYATWEKVESSIEIQRPKKY